jgi:tetratricopeptide (TPR) repeat protein
MRNKNSTRIGVLLLGSFVLGTITFSSGMEAERGDPAKRGWLTFLEVLAGDQTKFQLAVRQLEQAAAAAPTDVNNLFTLGRAYFYDAITHNNLASAERAERVFARVLELNPKHDALAFHGSVQTILSQGKDLEKKVSEGSRRAESRGAARPQQPERTLQSKLDSIGTSATGLVCNGELQSG